jgi:hypothetical protein
LQRGLVVCCIAEWHSAVRGHYQEASSFNDNMAQLANAGCASLRYYIDMLFRFSAIILTVCSVLFAGCRASHTTKAPLPKRNLAPAMALNHLPSDGTGDGR